MTTASWCAHQVVGRTHGRVTGVSSSDPDHPVDVLLDVLDKSLDDIDLLRACLNELLDGVIDLFLILAYVAELEELLLLCPLCCLSSYVA